MESAATDERRSSRVNGRGLLSALAQVSKVLLLVVCLGLLILCRVVPGALIYASTFVVCTATSAWLLRSTRDLAIWAAYLAAFVLFAVVRTLADETGIQPKFDYVISADRALFRTVPTLWLQERFVGGSVGSGLDWTITVIYLSYFAAPHIAALVLWRYARWLFARFVLGLLLSLFGGLAICFVFPTAPPSLASREGHLPPVTSVVRELTQTRSAQAYEAGERVAGANEVAAMPSLHLAVTAVIALALWRVRHSLGVAGGAYTLGMGFALVYNGSHYVVDLLAGAGLAGFAWQVAGHVAPGDRSS